MTMLEAFGFSNLASLPRDTVARPQWKLTGRLAWRITFFGKIIRSVEEEREHRDHEGARYSEKRWRDMRAGDLNNVEEIRTERAISERVWDQTGVDELLAIPDAALTPSGAAFDPKAFATQLERAADVAEQHLNVEGEEQARAA